MVISHNQNSAHPHNLLIPNESFENVAKFKYFGMTNKSKLHCDEIKSGLSLGNACYHSVQNIYLPISSLKTERLKYTKP
jgi:hypothetical protein